MEEALAGRWPLSWRRGGFYWSVFIPFKRCCIAIGHITNIERSCDSYANDLANGTAPLGVGALEKTITPATTLLAVG
jgi:hypothetical protein